MAEDRQESGVWDRLDYGHDALIEASAGTGKTFALENIVRKLVVEKGYAPDSILLVTFTEKAAGELKDRIRKALGADGQLPAGFDEMTICTIHSFCQRLLTEYAFENGVPMKCEIGGDSRALAHQAALATLESEAFCNEYYDRLYEALKDVKIKSVSELVKKIQSTVCSANYEKSCRAMEKAIAKKKTKNGNQEIRQKELLLKLVRLAHSRFEEFKKSAALLTFDDMVLRAAEVVMRKPQDEGEKLAQQRFFDSVRKRYRVALVDEFQDTDQRQWDIFRTLFSSEVNKVEGAKPGFLLVVGDPKQAIYSFRGADVEVYCEARDKLTEYDAKGDDGEPKWRKTLDKTYRSKKSLVEAFNIVFRDDGANCGKRGADWFRNDAAGEGIAYEEVEYPPDNAKFLGLKETAGQAAAVLLLESMPERVRPSTYNGGCFGNKSACLPVFMENAAKEILYLKSLDPAYSIRVKKKYGEGCETKECSFSYGDMCVLVDSKNDAAVVRRILASHGIPYGQYKQLGIYDSPEAEGVLALLDYLSRPNGAGNRAALLLSPIFRVHPSELPARTPQDDASFDRFMEELQVLAAKKAWNRLFERVMSDGRTALTRPGTDICAFNRSRAATRQIFDALLTEKGSLAGNASEFASLLREWRKGDKAAGDDGALYRKESEADRVQIMTMHASKGLQFPIVFLAYGFSGLVKGGTPKDEQPATLAERRRLLYVALTRAEHRLYLPWSRRAWEWTAEGVGKDGEKTTATGSGLGSVGSALLVGKDPKVTNGFLGRAIQVYFSGNENAAFAPERKTESIPSSADVLRDYADRYRSVEDVKVPGLDGRRIHWDSFSTISQDDAVSAEDEAGKPVSVANGDGAQQPPELHNPTVKAKTLLPRSNVSGNVFHEIMETLCRNGPEDVDFTTACNEEMGDGRSKLMELIRRTMAKNLLVGRLDKESGETTETVLLRMVQNALKTPIKIGGTEFLLKDIPKKDRLAEVEFVMDEQNLLAGLPEDRDGALNGKIDLLVRVGDMVFIIDWKTNSLPDYEGSVNDEMDEAGYHLQYKIYSLAASEWLTPHGLALGGVAYLFVRGGEVGDRSGVFSKAFDGASLDGFRDEISKMGHFAAGLEGA